MTNNDPSAGTDALLTRAEMYANGWTPCPHCSAESGQANEGRGWFCSECGGRRNDKVPRVIQETLRALTARVGVYEAALRHIADRDPTEMAFARTLHYDMAGWAQRALDAARASASTEGA